MLALQAPKTRYASEASTPPAVSGMSCSSITSQPSVSCVSEKAMSKIRSGELVDMAKLLRKDMPHDSGQPLSLSSELLQLAERLIPITSFYNWSGAFLVLMSTRGSILFTSSWTRTMGDCMIISSELLRPIFPSSHGDVLCQNLCVVVLVLVLGLLHLSIKPRFNNTEMSCS